ncbi:MAG: hypothetical protein LUD18_02650, partial [Lachnospiraceae bacterium]|nr:hypothetical protein [Lachnospiraceae bacterium]
MRTEDEKTGKTKNTEKQLSKSKVTPFRFPYNESDDPVVDAFILQGLQKEADEAEARVNSDPELSQINPPDDQYEKIVARLKEMGIWEEDEEEEKRTEEEHEKEVEEARKEIAAANQKKETECSGKEAAGVVISGRECSEKRTCGEVSGEIAGEIAGETSGKSSGREILEEDEVYQMLSEKDREAITLGRRAQEKREKRSRYIRMIVKRGGVVAAAFVLLISVSMNVSASRQWIVQMWGAVTEVFVSRTVTNNIEETKAIQSTVAESLAAMEEIEEVTGIPGLYFNYWPGEMEYLGYDIFDEDLEVRVLYSFKETIINVYMKNIGQDETS